MAHTNTKHSWTVVDITAQHNAPNAVCGLCRRLGVTVSASAERKMGTAAIWVCAVHAESARRWDRTMREVDAYRERKAGK